MILIGNLSYQINYPDFILEAKRLFKEANVTIGKYGTADLLPYYPDEAGDYDESAAGASSYDHSGSQTFSRSGKILAKL